MGLVGGIIGQLNRKGLCAGGEIELRRRTVPSARNRR